MEPLRYRVLRIAEACPNLSETELGMVLEEKFPEQARHASNAKAIGKKVRLLKKERDLRSRKQLAWKVGAQKFLNFRNQSQKTRNLTRQKSPVTLLV